MAVTQQQELHSLRRAEHFAFAFSAVEKEVELEGHGTGFGAKA